MNESRKDTHELHGVSDVRSVAVNNDQILYLDYTNWRGERAWRRVIPLNKTLEFCDRGEHCPNDKGNEKAWVMHVYDLDRQAERSYVLKDIHAIRSGPSESKS